LTRPYVRRPFITVLFLSVAAGMALNALTIPIRSAPMLFAAQHARHPTSALVSGGDSRPRPLQDDRRAAFTRQVQRGDAYSAKLAAELALSCERYADHTFASTLHRIEGANRPVSVKAKQKAVAEQQRRSCIGFDLAALSTAVELARLAYRSGDLHAFAWYIPADASLPELIARAQAAAALQDPVALREVAVFFERRVDSTASTTYDLGDDLFVTRNIIRDAFYLAACEFGDDCGPSNPHVTGRCVDAGWCDAGSLGDLYLAYAYPPADADSLLRTRDLIVAGVRSGHWPSGLWHPLGYDMYSGE